MTKDASHLLQITSACLIGFTFTLSVEFTVVIIILTAVLFVCEIPLWVLLNLFRLLDLKLKSNT